MDEAFTFGQMIKSAASVESKPCPDEKRCLYKNSEQITTSVSTTLINCPDAVTVGIIWDTDSPSSKYIANVLDCVGQSPKLYLVDMFDNIPDEEYRRLNLQLVGIVAYYGKHYVSFFYNNREHQWIYFDDEHVKKIGPNWENVVAKCRRNRFQPLLIVYSNSNGRQVDVINAPITTEIVSKEQLLARPQKSPTHRKHKSHRHHNRHKKGRSRSHSPAEPNIFPEPERNPSNSSSLSPHSPSRNLTNSPRMKTKNQQASKFAFQDENVNSHRYHEDRISDVGLESSLGLQIQTSVSDSDISAIVKNNQNTRYSFDQTDRKPRSDSLKKKFGYVMKNMKPISQKKLISKNQINNMPTQKSYDQVYNSKFLEDKISYADVGFNSPNQSRSKNQNINHIKKDSTIKQLDNLQRHQEMLERSIDVFDDKQDMKWEQNAKNLSENISHQDNDNDEICRDYDDETDRVEYMNTSEQHKDVITTDYDADKDLIYFNSRPDIVTLQELPSYQTYTQTVKYQGEFENLINKGDYLMDDCEKYERQEDILLALRYCTAATVAYRDASRLPKISKSLVQYVDHKRWCSYKHSCELQRKVEDILNGDEDVITSDHDSMLDAQLSELNTSVSPDLIKNDVDDLVILQNQSARVQALTRSNKNVAAHPQQNNFAPNAKEVDDLQTILKSLDAADTTHVNRSPSFPRTSLQWVIDKPNNRITGQCDKISNAHSSSIQTQGLDEMERLRQPKIPVDQISDLRSSMQRNPKLYDPTTYARTSTNKMNSDLTERSQQDIKSSQQNHVSTMLNLPSPPIVTSNINKVFDSNSNPTNSEVSKPNFPNMSVIIKTLLNEDAHSSNLPDKIKHEPKYKGARVKSVYDNLDTKSTEHQINDVTDLLVQSGQPDTIYDDVIGDFSINSHQSRTKNLIDFLKKQDKSNSYARPKSNTYTLEKLKERGKNNYRCVQCGWRAVDFEGTCCDNCQSEYL